MTAFVRRLRRAFDVSVFLKMADEQSKPPFDKPVPIPAKYAAKSQ
ncbi:MAG: hypothetical protein ACR2KU_07350 [Gammaproteobacteria bacterium]